MRIKITQESIDKNKHCFNNCPVYNGFANSGIDISYVTMSSFSCVYWSEIGLGFVRDWIYDYDCGKKVEPFEFNVSAEALM